MVFGIVISGQEMKRYLEQLLYDSQIIKLPEKPEGMNYSTTKN